MSTVIQQIEDADGKSVLPVTNTKAVYDDNNNRLDNVLATVPRCSNAVTSTSAVARDADTLAGNQPAYYATAASVSTLSDSLTYNSGDVININTANAVYLCGRTTGTSGQFYAYYPTAKTIKATSATVTPTICRVWGKSGNFLSPTISSISASVGTNGITMTVNSNVTLSTSGEMLIFEFIGKITFS